MAAFITFAAVYRLDLSVLADAVWATAPKHEIQDAYDKYEWAKKNGYHAGLSQHVYAACEYLKTKWRSAHPKTVAFWRALEDGFRQAIDYNHTTFEVEGTGGKLAFRRDGDWLRMRLPSGRCLTYLRPYISKGNLWFWGLNPFTKQFGRVHTYSGRLSENATSGTARDVLFYNLPKVEAAGYGLLTRVHDEVIVEADEREGRSPEHLSSLIASTHPWCRDLPLAAKGIVGPFYRKE